MGIHLKGNEIDNLVSGIADSAEMQHAEEHLRVCSRCREKVRILSGVVNKRESDAVPGTHVKAAVLAEWHRINSTESVSVKWFTLPLKAALAIAASFIIGLTVYIGIISNAPFNKERDFSLAGISGDVRINDTIAKSGDIIREGYNVVTTGNSFARIKSDNYQLNIEGSTEIRLASNNEATGFNFVLHRGSIVSRSFIKLQYSFTCGEYKVMPLGTEFRLDYSDGIVKAAVSSGEIMITGKGFDTRVLPGMSWSSDSKEAVLNSTDKVNGKKKTTADKSSYSAKNPGESEVESSEETSGKDEKLQNRDDIRDMKREIRKDIREIKNEKKRERQFRGGN